MTQNYIERYWRDATPEDAIKEPPMVARFRDKDDKEWLIGKLFGVDRSRKYKWCGDTRGAIKCQVYDAPDPGEGWRLIDPDKDSYQQDGIEYCERWQANWHRRDELSWMPFSRKTFYRIRITPTVTYVPFTWEDREQLRGRWYRITLSCGEIRECQIEFFRLDRGVFFVGSFPSEQLLEKGAIFLDTGKPVGKEVTQ